MRRKTRCLALILALMNAAGPARPVLAQDYAAREAESPHLEEFSGGSVFVTGLVFMLLQLGFGMVFFDVSLEAARTVGGQRSRGGVPQNDLAMPEGGIWSQDR